MSFFYKNIKKIYDKRNSYIFYPIKEIIETPKNYGIDYIDLYLTVNDTRINGWYCKNTTKKIIFYLHGNAGNISTRTSYINFLYNIGYSVMIIDYPGFGNSEGEPTEESCLEACKKFYDYILKIYDENRIILHGESIGTSIAANLSNIYKTKYLVLLSPFTSLSNLVNETIYFGSIFGLFCGGFNTLEYLKKRYKINSIDNQLITVLVHSKNDELVNYKHSEILLQYATRIIYLTGAHSSPEITNEYIKEMMNLIK